MKQQYLRMVVVLVGVCLLVSACGGAPEAAATQENPHIKVEQLDGQNPTRETLSEEAVKRLDIQTAAVQEADGNGATRTIVPYAAIFYDTQGATWVYLSPAPHTFVRHAITVDDIRGDQAFLSDALPAGSAVVTVGVAELYGAETEFEEE